MYNQTVMTKFLRPENAGALRGANAVGKAGNSSCGDVIKLYLLVDEEGVVEDPLADACCTSVVHLNSAEKSRVCRKNEESGNSGEAGNQHVSVIRVSGCDAEGGNHCRSNRLGSSGLRVQEHSG